MRSSFHTTQNGFTLVEMVVVLAIFGVITTTVLFNYGQFRTTVSLENLAQDIALSIRKTQSYASSVRGVQLAPSPLGETVQFPGYGIHFNLPSGVSTNFGGSSKAFAVFADLSAAWGIPGDGKYNDDAGATICGTNLGPGNECVEYITITTADKISKICTTSNGTTTCGTSNIALDILFIRPKIEPTFCLMSGSTSCSGSTISKASIEVTSALGDTKTITIWNTGQISTL